MLQEKSVREDSFKATGLSFLILKLHCLYCSILDFPSLNDKL